MDLLVFAALYIAGFVVSYRWLQPLAWRLFRATHRNNPEALAFADQISPRKVSKN